MPPSESSILVNNNNNNNNNNNGDRGSTVVKVLLRYKSEKFACSIPAGVIGIFH